MCGYGIPYEMAKDVFKSEPVPPERKSKQRLAKEIVNSVEDLPIEVLKWAKSCLAGVMYYTKERRGVYRCICSNCNEETVLTHAKSGRNVVCPHCGRAAVIKMRKEDPCAFVGMWGAFAYLEKRSGAYVQRLFFMENRVEIGRSGRIRTFRSAEEEERDVWFSGDDGYYTYHRCKLDGSKNAGKYIPGPGLVHGMGWSAWRLRECRMRTFPKNLKEIFSESEFRYSGIKAAADCFVNPFDYLYEWKSEPKLELVAKIGLVRVLEDIIKGRVNCYQMSKLRELRSLKEMGIKSREDAEECRELSLKDIFARKEVKKWDVAPELRVHARNFSEALTDKSGEDFRYSFITRERLFKYWLTQDPKRDRLRDFLHDYIDDYIPDCLFLGKDLNDTAVCAPKDFYARHHAVYVEVKAQKDREYVEGMKRAWGKWHSRVEWESRGLCVVMPKSAEELLEEGRRQINCVGGYVERIAMGKSVVLFIRRTQDVSTNFYTLEIRPDMEKFDVVQCRGLRNCKPTKEIEDFLKRYERWYNSQSAAA